MPSFWTFKNTRTSSTFTSDVLSATLNHGRRSILDNFSSSGAIITIRNQNDQAAGFQLGDEIGLEETAEPGVRVRTYYVYDIQYANEFGNMTDAEAVLLCYGAVGRLGRADCEAATLTTTTTILQYGQVIGNALGVGTEGVGGQSIASSATYTGSALARTNILVTTEGGVLNETAAGNTAFYGRSYFGSAIGTVNPADCKFGRTFSGSQIGYKNFTRRRYGQEYANDITVEPSGLASQRAANVTSLPRVSDTYSTVDSTTTQALDMATFERAVRSDTNNQVFEFTISDAGQNTASTTWQQLYYYAVTRGNQVFWTVAYREPGDVADTTALMFGEFTQVRIQPSHTEVTFVMSPLDYYNYFTLDSTTLGILNTNRLAW